MRFGDVHAASFESYRAGEPQRISFADRGPHGMRDTRSRDGLPSADLIGKLIQFK